jgi:hypothetical protein
MTSDVFNDTKLILPSKYFHLTRFFNQSAMALNEENISIILDNKEKISMNENNVHYWKLSGNMRLSKLSFSKIINNTTLLPFISRLELCKTRITDSFVR